jgi:hypothetical protein
LAQRRVLDLALRVDAPAKIVERVGGALPRLVQRDLAHGADGDAPGSPVRQDALRDVRLGVRHAAAQDAEALELGVPVDDLLPGWVGRDQLLDGLDVELHDGHGGCSKISGSQIREIGVERLPYGVLIPIQINGSTAKSKTKSVS